MIRSLRAFAAPLLFVLVGCDGATPPPPHDGSVTPTVGSAVASAPSAKPLASAASATSATSTASVARLDSASAAPPGLPTGPIASAVLAPLAPVAASSAVAPPSPASADRKGLPASTTGVLKPGEADRVHAKKAPPKVKLLEAGAEPRERITYAFRAGERVELPIALDVAMTMRDAQGNAMPTAVPRMIMRLDMNTKDVTAGTAGVEALLLGLDLAPQGPMQQRVAEALGPQLGAVKGLRMTYKVANDGTVSAMEVKLPEGAPAAAQQTLASMSQSFESMTAPFPKEALGTGARWSLTGRVASGGADILQRVTYTLLGREGDRVKLGLTVVQLAADPAVRAPGMPEQVRATMKAFRSEGGGDLEVRLDRPAAEHGTLKIQSAMTVLVTGAGPITAAGGAQESAVESTMTVTYGAVKP